MFATVVAAIASSASRVKNAWWPVINDVGEGEQTGEDVVVDHHVRQVLEEEVALLLVDVEAEIADLAGSSGR